MEITLDSYRHENKVTSLESGAIQKAMDSIHAAGGGRVVLKPGTYRCATIYLRSKVNLHLEEGALILGTGVLNDYPQPDGSFIDAVGDVRGKALIYAEGQSDFSITGKGIIDGNGGAFPIGSADHKFRPFLCRLVRCSNVLIDGIGMRAAAAWTCHLMDCEDMHIKNILIDSRVNENNDGIDIDSSRRVNIENCHIATDDDAICLKATSHKACEDITVTGCTLITECAALKIGTESYGDIRRVRMSDCNIPYAATGAIKILSSDGAYIEDVNITNIKIDRATGPIFIRLGERGRTYEKNALSKKAGKIKGITLRNISAKTFIPPKDIAQPFTGEIMPARGFSGVFITGLPNHHVEDIFLDDVQIEFTGTGVSNDIGRTLAEEPAMYPELFYFGALPAYGFYFRHARNIKLNNVRATLANKDARPLLASDDVLNLDATGLCGQ